VVEYQIALLQLPSRTPSYKNGPDIQGRSVQPGNTTPSCAQQVLSPRLRTPDSRLSTPASSRVPQFVPLTAYNNIVIMTSAMWEIEHYETTRQRCPVQEFIDSLDARSKARVARAIDLLERFGIALGMPYAKHVEGELWELRTRVGTSQYRIIYFLFTDKVFILLHGFAKKSGRIPERDLKAARDRRDDFLSRRRQA